MLVDKTIGQLVEQVDNKTVLILSADDPLRITELFTGVSDPRVPFVAHLRARGFREDDAGCARWESQESAGNVGGSGS